LVYPLEWCAFWLTDGSKRWISHLRYSKILFKGWNLISQWYRLSNCYEERFKRILCESKPKRATCRFHTYIFRLLLVSYSRVPLVWVVSKVWALVVKLSSFRTVSPFIISIFLL
jgi:hypothetical protein